MRFLFTMFLALLLSSCWQKIDPRNINQGEKIVWGYKPIYAALTTAKQIIYSPIPQSVVNAGNIYAKDNLIYQVETGRGIHVIDNSVPSSARRVGFLTINGCNQISIKNSFLYSNSYDDLVVIDLADVNNIREIKRVAGAFPEGRSGYYFIQPPQAGYYECPRYDSVVTGWIMDSVKNNCFRN